jgi:hypothetical protein
MAEPSGALSWLRTLVIGVAVGLALWWTRWLRDKLEENRRLLAERDLRIGELTTTLEERDREIGILKIEIKKRDARIQELEAALRLLKVDHRVARIEVLAQESDPADPTRTLTTVRFTELDQDGEPIGPALEATLAGKLVYVESLVIKFDDSYVEKGDALRGSSICFFKRLFGEDQKPIDGVALDEAGALPRVYAPDDAPEPSALHRELWSRFWDYANDPALAETLGVRALHGEAPFIEARAGKTYRVELRASGGLAIQSE